MHLGINVPAGAYKRHAAVPQGAWPEGVLKAAPAGTNPPNFVVTGTQTKFRCPDYDTFRCFESKLGVELRAMGTSGRSARDGVPWGQRETLS
jgi:hypothetical protein